jgi:hypothetical protein
MWKTIGCERRMKCTRVWVVVVAVVVVDVVLWTNNCVSGTKVLVQCVGTVLVQCVGTVLLQCWHSCCGVDGIHTELCSFFLFQLNTGEAMLAIMSKYDDDDDVDDTLDSMTSSLRMRSDISAYSDEEEEQDGAEEDIEILEVSVVNGVRTGVVRNAEGKKVQVLMPNMNRSAKISANSRGRGRKRGGGGGVDTRKCFNCGESGHLSNECPKPRMTGSELGKIKKAKKEQKGKGEAGGGGGKKTNKSKGVSGGGSGNAKGTKASNERQRKRNEKNKSSRANHNRKKGALKKAGKGM